MKTIYVIERHENIVEYDYSYVIIDAVGAALTRAEAESCGRAHDENEGKELYANHPWLTLPTRKRGGFSVR